jgi:hypothetical protein
MERGDGGKDRRYGQYKGYQLCRYSDLQMCNVFVRSAPARAARSIPGGNDAGVLYHEHHGSLLGARAVYDAFGDD